MPLKSRISDNYHLLLYSGKRPKMHLEKAALIFSIDVDVGCRELGVINKGRNDKNIRRKMSEFQVGRIEEKAVPELAKEFEDFEVPVTFAMRGQLTEVDSSLLKSLLDSSIEHDMAAHGYYHVKFTDLLHSEADQELRMISNGMKKFGINPKSFVFPKNGVAHIDLLEKYGYKCYRGVGSFFHDDMCVERTGSIYNIHPSLYITSFTQAFYLKRILALCVLRKLPFHIWFHPWNFGETTGQIQASINRIFSPFLKEAVKKRKLGLLNMETMLSVAEKVERTTMDARKIKE